MASPDVTTGSCRRGHAMTEENTYTSPDGTSTECRICRRARKAAYKARKRAEARGENAADVGSTDGQIAVRGHARPQGWIAEAAAELDAEFGPG